jgi:hypothetical protein
MLGGTYRIEAASGKGTTIIVEVPIAEAGAASMPTHEHTAASLWSAGGMGTP